ncbi:MAG TPA: branched-chain amino acid ABC transporter permease [Ktedonobacterales bacterium]|nr:branched-chain amino acid ABC transporter permease [Ktedonobacterales bacterium]
MSLQASKQRQSWRATAKAQLNSTLDNTKIGKYPLRWYLSGWRAGLFWLFLAALVPWVLDSSLQVTAITIAIYVMLALGLNIVVGYAGLLDLGYVAFYVIGAYTMAAGSFGFIQLPHEETVAVPAFSFWVLLPLGAILAGFFGVLLGAPTLRLRGDYLAIVTLGFGEIVPIVFNNVPYFYGPVGISSQPPPDLGPIQLSESATFPAPFYYLTLVLVVLLILGVYSLRESSLGRAWVAIREDETAAATSGVNLVRTKLLAFGLGATVGGIGGVMNAAFTTSITPKDFSFNISITILIMVVLGGLGSVPGVIVGAILLRFFDVYLLSRLNDAVHTNPLVAGSGAPLHFLSIVDFNTSKYLIYGLILVAMILLRPQGLIPDRRRTRELHGEGIAADTLSAVGTVEREEAGEAVADIGAEDRTAYTGAGSDAQGRED